MIVFFLIGGRQIEMLLLKWMPDGSGKPGGLPCILAG